MSCNNELKKKTRQYRNIQQNLENKDNYIVEGYCLKYAPYVLYEEDGQPIYEEIIKSAFDECDLTDVIMQYDHSGRVFARQSNGTLQLKFDDVGLHIRADLSKSENGRNLYEEIQNGLITKMSWGFMPSGYRFDKKRNTIIHTKIKKIFDVSAVSLPANNDTEIYSRSFVEGVIDKMTEEFRSEAKKKLEIKLKLMRG